MVGSGLAGAGGAASMAELGYQVKCFCYQDSPRRAHSIAAQGGINAAKNYRNDGDSVYRLFYDTIKGGDFRAREANVYRLAEVSRNIIDQCVAQGVPFAREYGGLLDNRSFGGAQVSRTFYARGQTGQQLLLGAYQALERQIGLGSGRDVHAPRDAGAHRRGRPRPRRRRARHGHGRARDPHGRRGVPGDRRLRQRLLPRDLRQGLQHDGDLARVQEGRRLREPLLHADPPDLHPRHRRLPVEADAHERVAPQRRAHLGSEGQGRQAGAGPDPGGRARLLPRAHVPELRQPRAARHRLARRQAGLRRGPRRRADGPRRLPRLPGRHRAPRQEEDRGEVRQPLRNVRAHHRRESLQGPDAHLPRHALHDGRPVGGLQPDEHDPGTLRARRGELLGPRGEPARGVRPDAGPGRRLLHHPVHDRQLPRPREVRAGRRPTTPRSAPPRPRSPTARSACSRSAASAP